MSARRPVLPTALGLVLALLAAAVLERVTLRQGNTLHANGRWESTKVGLEKGILGAVSFLVTRPALHRDRLDLGAWHGFHELLLREPVSPERVALRFSLRRAGWVAAITANDGARFEAVRLSRDPALPSACLAGTVQGKFEKRGPFEVPELGEGWHDLALEREGGALAVSVDGREVARCAAELPLPTRVGVRGSAQVRNGERNYPVKQGDVLLLPAEVGACQCIPDGDATVLECGVPEPVRNNRQATP